jgi:hypothetical protein
MPSTSQTGRVELQEIPEIYYKWNSVELEWTESKVQPRTFDSVHISLHLGLAELYVVLVHPTLHQPASTNDHRQPLNTKVATAF